MQVEKEVIGPGTYWYSDEKTGLPRKLDVTSDLTRYWLDQGQAMLKDGLAVPVPYEHDFSAHPMTPRDKLLNNAGEVQKYYLRDIDDPKRGKVKDVLFATVDVQDPAARDKIGKNIRWSSPWISSFTDGNGKQWNNVIAHLALTTRPRITQQQPFTSIAAALSMANPTEWSMPLYTKAAALSIKDRAAEGICVSRATLLAAGRDNQLRPRYPMAFSIATGIAFGDDMPKKKAPPTPDMGGDGDVDGDDPMAADGMDDPMGGGDDAGFTPDADPSNDNQIDLEPFNDPAGDVTMEEVLCDLLGALGVYVEKTGNEAQFKRSLYTAAMTKVSELTQKGQSPPGQPQPGEISKMQQGAGKPGMGGAAPGGNPLIQQEQQPMYMSIEEINAIVDPVMKKIALSMYQENVRLRSEAKANADAVAAINAKAIADAKAQRAGRIALLGKVSPTIKARLERMVAAPGAALSMGGDGQVHDPLADTLALLEAGLGDMPALLTADMRHATMQPHPVDGDVALSQEDEDKLVEDMARRAGAPPARQAS